MNWKWLARSRPSATEFAEESRQRRGHHDPQFPLLQELLGNATSLGLNETAAGEPAPAATSCAR
jgi:hypothetical protein